MSAWKRFWKWQSRHSFMIGILVWTYLLLIWSENLASDSDDMAWLWSIGILAALACLTQHAWDAIKGREVRENR